MNLEEYNMNIQITKNQLKVLLEETQTPEEQLETFRNTENRIKSLFISKKTVKGWKEYLEKKYPSLEFRFQIGNDILIAQPSIKRNL